MDTILIVCGAGASSTFLASRMRSLARTRGIELSITAASDSDLADHLSFVDVLLVGPHLAPRYSSLSAQASDAGAASLLLPATAFGTGGAEAALDAALELLTPPITNEGILHG